MNDNKFISEVLQQVAESKGDAEQVHSFLKAKPEDLEDLDETLVENFPSITQRLLKDRSPEEQKFIAQTLLNFSTCISKFPLGNRALNLELAKVSCSEALEIFRHNKSLVNQAKAQNNLGNIYSNRIRGDRANNIEEAIECHNNALDVFNSNTLSEQWATATCALGNAYFQRIKKNRAENIEQAIKYYQTVLNVGADTISTKLRATAQNLLGNAYVDRIQENRAENIEQAIKCYEAALDVYKPDNFPNQWAAIKHNLGHAFYARIRGKRAENVKRAIKYYEDTLTVRKKDTFPMDWATTCNGLGDAYARIQEKRAENLERAIKYYEDALTVRKKDAFPIDWATTYNGLGDAYARIQEKRAENLERAIKYYEDALMVRKKDAFPIDWATTCNNLANVYRDRIKGERIANLEEAIEGYEAALTVRKKEDFPVEWAQTKNNLSIVYYNRFQGGRAANLEEAIEGYEAALTVRKKEDFPVEWATTRHTLATAYYARIKGDRSDNLEEAIAGYEAALTVRKKEDSPVEWAQTENNLANAYFDRLEGDKSTNLERAIESYKNALMVRKKEDFPMDWAQTKNNLANAYSARLEGDKNDNIRQAIGQYKATLEVYTRNDFPIDWANTQYNLANTYASCIDSDGVVNTDINFYEKAIYAAKQALEIFEPQLLPNECRLTARFLGNLYSDQQHWNDANIAYGKAIESAEVLYQSALSRSSQEAELAETNDLFRRAAFAQAKIENQLTNAVTTIEQGRARGLRETLERDRIDLSGLEKDNREIYEQYQKAAAAVRQFEIDERAISSSIQERQQSISETELRQHAETVRQGLSDAVTAIRQCPGYENFLKQPSFDDIAAAIQPGQPLVYLLATSKGGLALIVHQVQFEKEGTRALNISPIWLDKLTDTSLRELLVGSGEEPGGWFGSYPPFGDRAAWLQTIDQVTHQLWTMVMEPVVTHLESLKVTQAVLIPTGYLSFLPLHAAWTEGAATPTGRHYALDSINFTYAPNAISLKTARAIGETTKVNSLLAINEPRPIKNAKPLPASEREVEVAVDYFKDNHKILKHEEATREAVLAELPNYREVQKNRVPVKRSILARIQVWAGILLSREPDNVMSESPNHNVLHFSCHGYANFNSPLDSGLLMANNEILSLRDFFDINLQGVRLAILSACETGLPGMELPDEVISLPTGLLQAGVAGVMASLWAVSDLSTMMLLVYFYDGWQKKNLEPTQALRNAQQWVRDTPNGEKEAYFKGFIDELAGSRIPYEAASELYQSVAFSDPDANDVAHPFYWAAFTYVGI
ncbi:CHAT domain-containing protein [Leptolyngbyaceae cyanobacterium CCMR0082]|uniref:CHAT domain-containing protein n=1 Tax=Adonisia turfae CCMR0082 TaxID=2304604 RepID=A0A6M0SCX6_9CYAN|nr:CHAT domain-containing protein [Adonisia turfae]NEZ66347.1 CHAT domain-containing protein [Adonisia turfae CCMR0082]